MANGLPVVVKPRARVITMVWGERYLDEFLAMTLPALLAPGNLPALIQYFSCELVIVTEEAFFARIKASPAFQRAGYYCETRLVMCDDLIVSRNMYGHSLTHALHRGFADLGERMTDTYLLFLNADFVLADGSYRTLVEHMRSGDRLIFAPSYCVVSEQMEPVLRARVNPVTGALAIPPREMAALALAFKHNTIRAKIVNRRVFHMDVTDQFYWHVDEHTLLGRQMPVAIVCMKPQQVYTDPVCFWDYATISMACPTAPRIVLGESDDFLMVELRGRDAMLANMRLGPISQDEIARVLGGYMTADQIELGKYPLTLHSHDLPPRCERASEALARYVEVIYERLPAPMISHVDHPYWTGLIDQFRANQVQWRQQREAAGLPLDAPALAPVPTQFERGEGPAKTRLSVVQRAYHVVFGTLPKVTRRHPYWANLVHANRLLEQALEAAPGGRRRRVLVVKDANEICYLSRAVEMADCEYLQITSYVVRTGDFDPSLKDFDLCLCDLGWVEMNEFVTLHRVIRPRMCDGGLIVAFHASRVLRTLAPENVREIAKLLPPNAMARIYFSGSPAVAAAIDCYERALKDQAVSGKRLTFAARMLVNAWWSWRANRELPAHDTPHHCTAITIEVEIL